MTVNQINITDTSVLQYKCIALFLSPSCFNLKTATVLRNNQSIICYLCCMMYHLGRHGQLGLRMEGTR